MALAFVLASECVAWDAGQWYWYDRKVLGKGTEVQKKNVLKLSNLKVQDIDNLVDWKLAELKYKLRLNEKY